MNTRVQIGRIELVHEDHRRAIAEFNGDNFSVQHFKVKEPIPLGNHYHKGKTETFTILQGDGILLLQDTTNPSAATEFHRLRAGAVVEIPPGWAHTFFLKGGSEMLCRSSARFDEANQDMHPHLIRMPIGHIAAVGIIYPRSNPRRIYLETKDDGLPAKVFRGGLCFTGGNWIDYQDKPPVAKFDASPRATVAREVDEELTFERFERDRGELVALGQAEPGTSAPTSISGAEITDEDRRDLALVKQAITDAATPFGDYFVEIPKEVFERGDPGNPKLKGNTHLVSYFESPLDDETWNTLERLQKKFGNLSNEAISTITSLDEINRKRSFFAYGHGRVAQEFFRRRIGSGMEQEINIIPGMDVFYLGPSLGDYSEYLKRYDVARKPV